jgi:hypothetical protein
MHVPYRCGIIERLIIPSKELAAVGSRLPLAGSSFFVASCLSKLQTGPLKSPERVLWKTSAPMKDNGRDDSQRSHRR